MHSEMKPGTLEQDPEKRWGGTGARREPGEPRQSLLNIRVPLRAQISFLVPDFTAGMPNDFTLAERGGHLSLQKCLGLLQAQREGWDKGKKFFHAWISEQVVYAFKKSTQKSPCDWSPWSRRPKTLASRQTWLWAFYGRLKVHQIKDWHLEAEYSSR